MTDTTTIPDTFRIGDLTVHRLGFGSMQLTGPGVWGPPKDHDEAIRVLKRAVELGVDFIDTADSYGPYVAEELIAEALHPYGDGVVIATKAGLTRTGPNVWPPVGRPEYLRQEAEMSLRRLGLERIDLFQLHRIDPKVPLEDQVGELKKLQDEGKIRHIGLSEVSVDELRRRRRSRRSSPCRTSTTSPKRDAEALLDYSEEQRHRRSSRGSRSRPAGWPARAARSTELAEQHDATPSQLALAWLLQALAGDAADPRHVDGRAPRGQHAGREHRALARRGRRSSRQAV